MRFLSNAEEIRGAVITWLFVLVLRHIFEPEPGERLDEILAPAAEVMSLSIWRWMSSSCPIL